MRIFAERRVCPHCGRKVREPTRIEDYLCPRCGEPGPWATEEQAAGWQAEQEALQRAHAAAKEAAQRYRALLHEATTDGDLTTLVPQMRLAADEAGLSESAQREAQLAAFRAAVKAAIVDDIFTPAEHERLSSLMSAFRLTPEDLDSADQQLSHDVQVAQINSGYLPEVPSPHLMAKSGEIVHIEVPATLMKEVAVREFRGGYSGFSFPIGKTGIRYKVGGARGHSVEVGTKLQVADSGLLAVTNKRAVYMGSRKTVDMPYSKLVNLTVYSDGIVFHLSNRTNAPLFTIASGTDVVAAVVNAAAQRG
jgi:hypothetical protein